MFKPRTTLIALFVLLPSFATLAQTRRPITHEDVWLMKRVGAPVPSPDGKWVVFFGNRTCLRRKRPGIRSLDCAGRRERQTTPVNGNPGRRERSSLEPRQSAHSIFCQA